MGTYLRPWAVPRGLFSRAPWRWGPYGRRAGSAALPSARRVPLGRCVLRGQPGLHGDGSGVVGVAERAAAQAVAPRRGGEQLAARRVEGQPADNDARLVLRFLLQPAHVECLRLLQVTLV